MFALTDSQILSLATNLTETAINSGLIKSGPTEAATAKKITDLFSCIYTNLKEKPTK